MLPAVPKPLQESANKILKGYMRVWREGGRGRRGGERREGEEGGRGGRERREGGREEREGEGRGGEEHMKLVNIHATLTHHCRRMQAQGMSQTLVVPLILPSEDAIPPHPSHPHVE